MNIESGLLPIWFLVLCGLLSSMVLLWAAVKANWTNFRSNSRVQHFFFAVCLGLGLFWSIRAGISAGMGVHFIGMVAATLLMGWPLALLAGAIGLLGISVAGLEVYESLGVNFLFSVALPCFTGYWTARLVQTYLPPNPFIYIFLCGFFNGAISMTSVACSTSLMLGFLGIYEWSEVYHNYFRYLPLMLFPEAFLNGMIVAGLVGTVPHWLSTFDIDKYFRD